MHDLATQISSKSKDRSPQARIPAPATETIDANHGGNAKKIAHAPPVCLESLQATLQLGSPGNDDLNAMTPEEKADAKKLAYAPPVYLESTNQATFRLGSPGMDDLKPMTPPEEKADAKKLAHAPPVYLESDQATFRLGSPGKADLNAMTPEEKADAKKLAHAPPVYSEPAQASLQLDSPGNDDLNPMAYGEDEESSDRANPGAFRVGGDDDDDGNTVTYGEAVWSHGVTTNAFHVNARLVEEGPEETIAVAVVPKKRFIYISMGVLGVLLVVVVIVLAVTLSTRSPQSGTTPALTPAPTPPPTPAPFASASGGTRNLFTTLAGTHRYFGHMFDITAKTDLRVVSMDIHMASTTEEIIELWAKEGPYHGFETQASQWTKIGEANVVGKGTGQLTPLPRDLFQPVRVNAGETQAFFVTATSEIIWFQEKMLNGTSLIDYGDKSEYFNSDLDLNVGTGVSYGFGWSGPPNIFNGALNYELV